MERKIQGQNPLHRQGRQRAGPVPEPWLEGRKSVAATSSGQHLNLCRRWSCCNRSPQLLTPSLCRRAACSPTVHWSHSPDDNAKTLGGCRHINSVAGSLQWHPVSASPAMTVTRGREAATVLCVVVTVRLRQREAVGPLQPDQTGSGVGFALCGSVAGDVPESMLRQVGCCEHPQMENWQSWGSPSSVHAFPGEHRASASLHWFTVFQYVCPFPIRTPTTRVLRGGEPDMDAHLAITAPKPRSRSEAGYGHALPGPLSFSTSGAGYIPHMSVLCQPGARYSAKPVLCFTG